jgi:hypothetical protein
MTYTSVIKLFGSDWVGWIEEIPRVNCLEETRDATQIQKKERRVA